VLKISYQNRLYLNLSSSHCNAISQDEELGEAELQGPSSGCAIYS
jgi:hypothetical protein